VLPTEPSFLRTCRLIRQEALAIWYQENNFVFNIKDHDACKHIEWCNSGAKRMDAAFCFNLSRSHNWPNLMIWVKAYYHDQCRMPGPVVGVEHKVQRIFSLVHKLRDCKVSWHMVKAILET